ncbi:serine/arginine repetitive matrix protein 2 [Anabrus simplex]|uniref:serine/arginine repetitive matrix protein 2 n=1 Tax=Anabrus simplex TaxID=316456 RepID=UPI0034DCC728
MSSWESSSRRSRLQANSSRLRMDSYGSSGRRSRAASPPKRRELDNVMKKARREGTTQSSYWTKKLLEVEEKDPNRWRHSGYKELYGGGNNSPHGSHSSHKRSRSRSPRPRRRSRVRSPPLPSRPRSRSRERERERERRPRTPEPQTTRQQSVPQRRPSSRRSPRVASLSASSRSLSSCSDESCSVCSPKTHRKGPALSPAGHARLTPHSRSRSFSVPRNRGARSPLPIRSGPKRQRERSGPPSDPRLPPSSPPPAARKAIKSKRKEEREKTSSKKRKSSRYKGERSKRRRSLPHVEGSPLRRRSSPPASCSDESSTSSVASGVGATKLTLSERFGKMAQWSVDRRDLDGVKNMRITKDSDSSDLKVVIEGGDRYHTLSPMPVNDRRVGLGYYPESQHPAPIGLDAWDDVRVRYKYYKDRGYLRDLTLDDYMKWEEWWYKYQEWLEAERYYEHWAAIRAEQTRSSRKRRRN